MKSNSEHWNLIFSKGEDSKPDWYEKDVSKTLKLLDEIPNIENLKVFLLGAGTSVLIKLLISIGTKLILNDISVKALK